MKIAVINELYGTSRQGGEQEAINNLAERLRGLDFQVDIYTYVSQPKIKSLIPLWLRQLPFIRDILILPVLGRKFLKNIDGQYGVIISSSATLFSFYKPKTPSLVICHAVRTQKSQILAKISRYKVLFNPLFRSALKYLEVRGLQNVTKIVTIKKELRDYLVQELQLKLDKIEVIPNAIDVDRFQPSARGKEDVVLFVGRGTTPKGIDILIEAAPRLKAKVMVVTKIINRERLRRGKQRGVQFVLNVPHQKMPEIYNRAKIFILPSLDEEQPLTILEAMASGLPVVTTEVGSGGLVEDNVNGYVIPVKDAQKLVEAVNGLLKRNDLNHKMSQTNRQQILTKHNWSMILPKYSLILKQIS